MKHFTLLFLIIMSFTTIQSQTIKAMTYNIRLDIASDGENAWMHRKDFLNSQILFFEPDFLGVQEAKPNQMADLKMALNDYKVIGLGRDGGDKGEHSSIFYNAKKYSLEQHSTFWLSETPDQVSKGWDGAYPRICTYALFTNLQTSKKILVFNTHLDHVGQQAQLNGIKKIQQKIAEVNTKNLPVVLMGDFNVEPSSTLITSLSETMQNTQDVAKYTFGPTGTFNSFKFNEPVTRKIDYIFISKTDGLIVTKHAILSESDDLRYPSDHFPVYVELMQK